MQKEIKYTGYTAMPSDYDCQDGELAHSFNLINEDGAIKPMCGPATVLGIDPPEKPLLKHHVPGHDNWIILFGDRKGVFYLCWLEDTPETHNTTESQVTNIVFKEQLTNLIDIAVVGNTICLATDQGMHYLLWKDGNYNHLGSRPPFIPINFGAYKVYDLTDGTSTSYDSVPRWTYVEYSGQYTNGANKPHASITKEDKEFWANVSNEAFGLLLKVVANNVSSKGYFYQPFFVRYAFRLYDGTYNWHSSPVLILPTVSLPHIGITCSKYGDGLGLTVTCSLNLPCFGLAHQILGDTEGLKEWSDIVTGIDIFISQPLYLYKQSEDLGYPKGVNHLYSNFGISADSSGSIFVGHYADDVDKPYIDRYTNLSTHSPQLVCNITPNDTFLDRIKNEDQFYKVATIDIDAISSMSEMKKVEFTKNDLSEINTLQPLEDEYNSHAKILPSFLHSYNGRLNMSGVSMCPAEPFPFCAYAEKATKVDNGGTQTIVSTTAKQTVRVYSRINGTKCMAEYDVPYHDERINYPAWYPFDNNSPRFLYVPDPNAYRMEVLESGAVKHAFSLSPHAHLNGAFWFGGLQHTPSFATNEFTETGVATCVEVSNKIYTSEVNNPFVFLAKNIVTIGCGKILGINSAAKALSQGQFGQFPLYAFTDDGVWALEISSSGTYSARQPITRDVVINRHSIAQIDSAVLFAADRGIMLLSGSQSQCISDIINTEFPFDQSQIIEFDTMVPAAYVMSFKKFIADCGIIYDYVHQRLIIYNPSSSYNYAYVYSMKSKNWCIMESNIVSHLPSYPEALAVISYNSEYKVVDFCMDDKKLTQYLITRPLKLDAADILKTVDTVIQRGNFTKGHVQSVLYGSRDLTNWHLVWSSKDHFMRGFRGTPYKYFRIALICDLNADESITGASVQFTPRYINKPR